MAGSYGDEQIYDNLNDFFERNSVFHNLTLAFLRLTFISLLGTHCLAGLLFVGALVQRQRLKRRRVKLCRFKTKKKKCLDSLYKELYRESRKPGNDLFKLFFPVIKRIAAFKTVVCQKYFLGVTSSKPKIFKQKTN